MKAAQLRLLGKLARELIGENDVGFALLVFPRSNRTTTVMDYDTNCPREEVLQAMAAFARRVIAKRHEPQE